MLEQDGVPFRIISGSVHYFRMLPSQYEDRLYKARMAGLNTVQTYVPWNLHNPQPGAYNLSSLVAFLQTAQGMWGLLSWSGSDRGRAGVAGGAAGGAVQLRRVGVRRASVLAAAAGPRRRLALLRSVSCDVRI